MGEFNATDPDAGATLSYSLASGAGDGNNSLFTLETNGTLKTAAILDYESGAILSVRVKVQDENNASNEGYFTISITDWFDSPWEKITAPDAAQNDVFGYSVSQSGNILAMGAHGADPGDTGAAYLYQVEINGSATYLTKVTAPDKAVQDYFGVSVSLSGNILAVGADSADPGGLSDAGAAYLYQLEANGSATYLTKVTAPDGAASDNFGHSVSQSGNILAVGANKANLGVYPMLGAAYLYQVEANGSATYLTKVTAPDAAASDEFGWSVFNQATILTVGASNANPGGTANAGAVIFINWKPMDPPPT